jgi:hypothetical protein
MFADHIGLDEEEEEEETDDMGERHWKEGSDEDYYDYENEVNDQVYAIPPYRKKVLGKSKQTSAKMGYDDHEFDMERLMDG